ncbi:transporter substrate-binding domain-containing protein [Hwanghaeella grinnelliae]|uniref:Transporter substrate-binding domain-containing protein n=1 Tax=Hwanghaeella grinnelliae TaxID=2500179 RepID=A0A437QWQ5_9PROT|nr:transporter substrate-binding domain-containing protein [Hwanghaeella grinnelliae]RVU38964.1 transporter substrate-binding domain-containing protein [Hwanghaeella grinnelliae]
MKLFRGMIVFLLLCMAGPVWGQDQTQNWDHDLHVSLATGDDYPPFTDERLPYGGFATRVVMRAFQSAGVQVDSVIWRPWNRVGVLTQESQVDAAFPYIVTPERAEQYLFSKPIFRKIDSGWQWSGSGRRIVDLNDPKAVEGLTFCLPFDFAAPDSIRKLLLENRITLQRAADLVGCFSMLHVGRVDVTLAGRDQAAESIAEIGVPRDEFLRSNLTAEIEGRLIVSKDHPHGPEIIAAFNAGLERFEATTEYAKLMVEFRITEAPFHSDTD